MSRPQTGIRILTAWRLSDGAVVFMDGEGGWSSDLDTARVARTEDEAESLMQYGVQAKATNLVVDPYLVDVVLQDGRLRPTHIRERIRVQGPTVGHSLPGNAPRAPLN